MTDHYLAMTPMQRKLHAAKAYLAVRGLAYRVYPNGQWREAVRL